MPDSRAKARPLAAIFLLREVRILPGGLFFHIEKFGELSYMKKSARSIPGADLSVSDYFVISP